MKTILLEKTDGIATVTLNRPEKFNSVNQNLALQFQGYLDDCNSDDEIRCIVITGNGRAFCAGQDLEEIVDPNGPPMDSIVREHFNPIVERIRSIPKPIVAAVNGVAAGAGANIALACDIVIAMESATFIQAFSKIGLIPDSGGTYFLPRLIGWQKASAIMMLGDKITARKAEDMGMIYKAVPDEVFNTSVNQIAGKLSKMPTKGLAYTKEALNQSFQNSF